ncbi:MAG: CAP domain-containing protein [Isosphaeraceae bacterium]|nr:CAP domain-containing protein [Isosphaeraceae bacterium]
MFRLIPAVVAVAAFVAVGCAGLSRPARVATELPSAPAPAPEDQAGAAARLLELHNAQRARAGLDPMILDDRLSAAALVQARDCARRDRLTHHGSDGSGPGERIARAGVAWSRCAENAAQQPRPPRGWPGDPRTPEWAMEGWMKSRGHRANLLGPYQRMGAAFADADNGTRYWVVVFANPR